MRLLLYICLFYLSHTEANVFSRYIDYPVGKNLKQTTMKYKVPVSLVIMDGKWTVNAVTKRFLKAREIYKQCDIGLVIDKIKVVNWLYPGHGLYFDLNDFYSDRYFDGTLQFLTDLNIQTRPLGIFLDSFDEYMPKIATAFPPSALHEKNIALNTFWITNKVNEKEYLDLEPDTYSVLAHELGHILLNDSHVYTHTANLMHYELSKLNHILTNIQCERMQNHIINDLIEGLRAN